MGGEVAREGPQLLSAQQATVQPKLKKSLKVAGTTDWWEKNTGGTKDLSEPAPNA